MTHILLRNKQDPCIASNLTWQTCSYLENVFSCSHFQQTIWKHQVFSKICNNGIVNVYTIQFSNSALSSSTATKSNVFLCSDPGAQITLLLLFKIASKLSFRRRVLLWIDFQKEAILNSVVCSFIFVTLKLRHLLINLKKKDIRTFRLIAY